MRWIFVVIVLVCLQFHADLVWAQTEAEEEHEQPLQEVFQTELVYPQEKNEIQLTLRPQFSNGRDENLFALPFTIEYGITNSWQVELEYNTFVDRDPALGKRTRGIGDLEIGTKYSFMNIANSNFHSALGFSVSFPTADIDKQLTEGAIEYEPFIIFAKDFPSLSHMQLFTQMGGTFNQQIKTSLTTIDDTLQRLRTQKSMKTVLKNHWPYSYSQHLRAYKQRHHAIGDSSGDDGEPNGDVGSDEDISDREFNMNSGFFIPIKKWRITSEINWSRSDDDEVYFTPGLVYSSGKWEFGVGVPIGLNNHSDNGRIIFNLIYEFNLSKE